MWSDATFDLAREKKLPVIVSIGYSTCHWCHVMEKESFEDAEVAAFMNEHFVCIKVDREELPHVDKFYMDALQSMQQQGGWPLNMFVTPDKLPFYGGTYFPPQSMYHKPSWLQILIAVKDAWQKSAQDLVHQGQQITEHLTHIQSYVHRAQNEPSKELLAIDWNWHKTAFLEHYDEQYGGWYSAPKFPQFLLLNNLVKNYTYTRDEQVLNSIKTFWTHITDNGLWDTIDGGLYRYAVDRLWQVPHFEKMLYDNALLLQSLSLNIQHAGMDELMPILKQQISFLQTYFRSAEGLYLTAFDADAEGVEGLYYLLTEKEYTAFIQQDFNASLFSVVPIEHGHETYYKINTSCLINDIHIQDIASIQSYLNKIRVENKVFPFIDEKYILSLNALLNTAFVKAYTITNSKDLIQEAIHLNDRLFEHFIQDKQAYRLAYGDSVVMAQSDDMIFLYQACLALYQITGDEKYSTRIKFCKEYIQEHFVQNNQIFLSITDIHHHDLPLEQFEILDNIIPSANSVYAYCQSVWGIFNADYIQVQQVSRMYHQMTSLMVQSPQAYAQWWYNFDIIKKGSIFKINLPFKPEFEGLIKRKYGEFAEIYWNNRELKDSVKEGEMIIQQCFEDRCELVYRGYIKEFEK